MSIIFYLLLLDAVMANLVSWGGRKWYARHFRIVSRLFPASRGWTTYYLILVIFIGFILSSAGYNIF